MLVTVFRCVVGGKKSVSPRCTTNTGDGKSWIPKISNRNASEELFHWHTLGTRYYVRSKKNARSTTSHMVNKTTYINSQLVKQPPVTFFPCLKLKVTVTVCT
jgi:hypothetical protein